MVSPPINVRVRLAYGVGQTAEGVLFSSFGMFLLFYYNQVLGLSGSLTGTALLIGLAIDAVTDPWMGAVSDRTRTRLGRRHPYIFASALPLGFFVVLLFSPPAGLGVWALFAWLVAFTVLARLALTLFFVPHTSLGAELSSDYQERNEIVAYRSFFSMLGYMLAMAVGFGWFFADSPSHPNGQLNPGAYLPFSIVVGSLMSVTILLSAFGTLSRISHLTPIQPSPKLTLRQFVSESLGVLSNSNFRAVFLGVFGAWASAGAYYAVMLHGYIHFWKLSSQQIFVVVVAMQVGSLLGMPVWGYASRFMEKHHVFMIAIASWAVLVSLLPILALLGILPPNGDPLYLPILITFWSLGNFVGAGGGVSSGSMVADCVDDHELQSGRRQEGNFFGVYAFSQKALIGVGTWLSGIILDLIAFPTNAVPGTVPEETLVKLALVTGPIVGIGGVLSLVFLRQYKISRTRQQQTLAQLAERRSA